MSPDRMTDHSRSRQNPARLLEPGSLLGPTRPRRRPASDIVPYAAPMFAYVALGGLETYLPAVGGQPSPLWYPLGLRAPGSCSSALLAWRYRATWSDFRPWPKAATLILAVLIGLVVWGMWIGLDGHYPALPFLGKRGGFDVECLGSAPGAGRSSG